MGNLELIERRMQEVKEATRVLEETKKEIEKKFGSELASLQEQIDSLRYDYDLKEEELQQQLDNIDLEIDGLDEEFVDLEEQYDLLYDPWVNNGVNQSDFLGAV